MLLKYYFLELMLFMLLLLSYFNFSDEFPVLGS